MRKKSIWSKPKEGHVLVNVDASFNPESHSEGIGAVIKDDSGRFIATCSDPVPYAIDANTLEAQAMNRRTALPNKVGCSRIIIQSKCLEMIRRVTCCLINKIHSTVSLFLKKKGVTIS